MLWKRIGLEDFEFPKVPNYNMDYIKFENKEKQVTIEETNEKQDKYFNINANGLGKKFTLFATESYNAGVSVFVPKNAKAQETIKLDFNMNNENPILIDKNLIVAEENSELTIIMDYSSDKGIDSFHNGITVVYAKENALVNIIKIQRMEDNSPNFDSNIGFVEGNGKINWISVEIGSSISGASYCTFLEGEASEANLSSIYLGDGTRKMDLEYTMIHKGPRSISNIETKGVLKDKSKKVFRGNLDFKKGARHSKGIEEEYVILLDPNVKSDSIPALLCEEDDVIGEHAASAGQINENSLFYLMSRGLNQREAKKLIVEASFRPIIDKIPFKDLQLMVKTEVERRLMDE